MPAKRVASSARAGGRGQEGGMEDPVATGRH